MRPLHVIWLCATIVQVIYVSHSEHNYFGDSNMEIIDDEEMELVQEPEESKSEYKSDVSLFMLYGKT